MLLEVSYLLALLALADADVQRSQANVTEKQLGVGPDCGSVLRGPEFRFLSPGYPQPPPRGLSCFYVIEAANPSICFLEFTFLTFDLGECGVTGDSLEVAGQVLCGGNAVGTRNFRFNPPRSLVVFRSGAAVGGKGFQILVRQKLCPAPLPVAQPDCSATYIAPQFSIQSPSGRSGGRVCEYKIVGSNRPLALCEVELLFDNFDLEPAAGCSGERLEVGDQDVLCGILTGTKVYRFVGVLKLRYISTKESIGKGFRILVVQRGCKQLILSNAGGGLLPPVPLPTQPPFKPSPPDPGSNYPHFPPLNPPFNPNIPQHPFPHNPNVPLLPLCCGVVYQSRHFYLTSPGFPYYYGNAAKECIYRIRPSGPDVCQLRIIFRFFWLGVEDSYTGCLNNGNLQLDNEQRICGCKTGAVLFSPFFQGQEKIFHYRGYSGGGFLLELFQENCRATGFTAVTEQTEIYNPLTATKERHGFSVNPENSTTRESSSTMNASNIDLLKIFPSERSTIPKIHYIPLEGMDKLINTSAKEENNNLSYPVVLNSSEDGGQHGNSSFIKKPLNKNCRIPWKFSVSEDSDKQVHRCLNRSNLLLENKTDILFKDSDQNDSEDNSGVPFCSFGTNLSQSGNLSNKIGECRTADILKHHKEEEDNKRTRRGVYNALGMCYNWSRMLQEARHFLWVNGLPRTLCSGSRRCQFFAEAGGWIKIPGYPPSYPDNVYLCLG